MPSSSTPSIAEPRAATPAFINKLILNTKLGTSSVILNFLDDKSQSGFFRTHRASRTFQKANYHNEIHVFLNNLYQELNRQRYWQHRRYPSLNRTQFAAFLKISIPIFLGWIIQFIKFKNKARKIRFSMASISYSLNEEQYCSNLLDSRHERCLELIDWGDCFDHCSYLAGAPERQLLLFSVIVLGVIALPLLAAKSVNNGHYYVADYGKALTAGKSRYNQVPLTSLSNEIQQQATQLFALLNQARPDPKDPLNLSTDSAIGQVRKRLSQFKRKHPVKGFYGDFFQTPNPAKKPVNSQVISEPQPGPACLSL